MDFKSKVFISIDHTAVFTTKKELHNDVDQPRRDYHYINVSNYTQIALTIQWSTRSCLTTHTKACKVGATTSLLQQNQYVSDSQEFSS